MAVALSATAFLGGCSAIEDRLGALNGSAPAGESRAGGAKSPARKSILSRKAAPAPAVALSAEALPVKATHYGDRRVSVEQFEIDPLHDGILAVSISVVNRSSAPVEIELAEAEVETVYGYKIPSMPLELVLERVKRRRELRAKVTGQGPSVVATAFMELERDFADLAFDQNLLPAGEMAEGIVFFGLPASARTRPEGETRFKNRPRKLVYEELRDARVTRMAFAARAFDGEERVETEVAVEEGGS